MEFKCYYSDCSRSYNSKYNLKRHINTNHLCLKNYPCDQCGRIFASKKNVLKHKVSHSDIILDSGPKSKSKKIMQNIDKNIEIPPIILSRHYVESKSHTLMNPISNKQTLPSLAAVDVCRVEHQSSGKIPLLPILLDHI